jgi:hypothetical protein
MIVAGMPPEIRHIGCQWKEMKWESNEFKSNKNEGK